MSEKIKMGIDARTVRLLVEGVRYEMADRRRRRVVTHYWVYAVWEEVHRLSAAAGAEGGITLQWDAERWEEVVGFVRRYLEEIGRTNMERMMQGLTLLSWVEVRLEAERKEAAKKTPTDTERLDFLLGFFGVWEGEVCVDADIESRLSVGGGGGCGGDLRSMLDRAMGRAVEEEQDRAEVRSA